MKKLLENQKHTNPSDNSVTMDLLIIDTIEPEVLRWLISRHSVRYAPELAFDGPGLRLALQRARAVIACARVPFNEAMLLQAPLLRALGRIHGGAENIDLQACARSGVDVVRSPTGTAQAEAEFMLGAMLSMLRRVPVLDFDGAPVGRELRSCVLGLVGMSPSAKVLSGILSGFGCELLGYDPALHANDSSWPQHGILPRSLAELLASADVLCVQLPFFSRYEGLLGERMLAHCKPDQVVVCVTHSAIFDYTALALALQSGRLGCAWLDSAWPAGTLDEHHPLNHNDKLQITHQLAGTTRESKLRSAWDVARRIDDLLALGNTPYHGGFRITAPDALQGD
jgi:D-3-phosphoglycerate dehydrogenase / 2-oxoglutarate reductase